MNEIIKKITPGNYWLTKSMEFNKVQTSGTLWYLKKWIVYYYYIIMRNTNLYAQDYNEIIEIFDNYIKSLPKQLQDSANDFFYEKNIKDHKEFNSYQNFISDKPIFTDTADERYFILNSKRFYFMYIMNLGGQSAYKKVTKDLIDSGNSYYSTLKKVEAIMIKDGHPSKKFKGDVEGDFWAPIRNDRQIFFYYGLFHGRNERSLNGFYNLTPIGKSILHSNFHEMIVLWEHQKIKMLSQSPVSKIYNLKDNYSFDSFSVNYHPYYSFLESLQELEGLSFDDYRYGISRTNNILKTNDVIEALKSNREK